jgi:hypothetical protein
MTGKSVPIVGERAGLPLIPLSLFFFDGAFFVLGFVVE